MTMEPKCVYQAIAQVTAAMAKEGIGKSRKNEQQGYKFRGIDDVYNAIASHMSAAGLCMLPYVVERIVTERPTKTGGVSTFVVLVVDFTFVSAVDGSSHMIRTMGEAMDTADKATNKAMSAAMKYACLMAFQIPTEGDHDTENAHLERAAAPVKTGSDSAERVLGEAFDKSASVDDIAAVEGQAARAVQAGQLTDAARKRLREKRAAAVARVSANGAAA